MAYVQAMPGSRGRRWAALLLAAAWARSAATDFLSPLDEESIEPVARLSQCGTNISQGVLGIKGLPKLYLAGKNNGTSVGDTLLLSHGAGLSVFDSCQGDWNPDSIAQFQLLGRTISFTVDLSEVGCGCNVAFYLIGAPARGMDGEPYRGKGLDDQPPYYCDANKVGGSWCPEIDLMEANNRVFQATPHRCEEPINGHYRRCDRNGCAQNTCDMAGAYGPGSRYTIDTRSEFIVHTMFLEDEGILTGLRTVLEQGTANVVLDHSNCDADYLAALSEVAAAGMSLRITYWGSDAETMAWLDAPQCGLESCNGGSAVIRSIAVSGKFWEGYLPEVASKMSVNSGELVVFDAPSPGDSHFEPKIDAVWECVAWMGGQTVDQYWCKQAGFRDGFMYEPGHDCWCDCCRQEGVLVVEPTTTRTETTTTTSAPDLVWVVSDPADELFGQLVPQALTDDATHFVSFEDHGVAVWEGRGRPVGRIARDDLEAPRYKKHRYYGFIMKKFSSFTSGFLPHELHWSQLACTVALAAAVVATAAAVVVARRRRRRCVSLPPSETCAAPELRITGRSLSQQNLLEVLSV